MNIGTINRPGPGLVPVIIGIIGMLVSLSILITGLKKHTEEKKEKVGKKGLTTLISYIIACIAFLPLFEYLGSVIAIFILVLALSKFSGAQGWVRPILLAVLCSGISYTIFSIALGVSLPQGIFF
jgi:putative tricarboxylic transport membrane protein